ncbi:MAG: hypothetical protein M3T96_08970 [Acidobacteriota bacterium]|nr:hypothetical protein [Acidobacteriota bacterium]
MNLFAGKSPAERNKIIAASVLGVLAIFALGYSIIGNPFGGKKKVTVTVSPTQTPKSASNTTSETVSLPTEDAMNSVYATTPIEYNPNRFNAPDAGRNIFAFYEPPPPTPYVAPPPPPEKPIFVPPPVPVPTPPQFIGFVTPQSVFAGSKTFRMEVNGDKFTPDSLIFLNGNQLPTTYINPQKLVADVPSNFIAGAGQIFVIVRSADGKLYSNQVGFNVQAPPVPQFQYVGVIARQKYNNDTAYFQEQGKPTPFGARLNDVVGGRFRLASISSNEVVFEDVNLGFKHHLALYRPAVGQPDGAAQPNPAYNAPGRALPGRSDNPNVFNGQPQVIQQGNCPPGIPCNNPQQPQPNPNPNQKDEDDDGNN